MFVLNALVKRQGRKLIQARTLETKVGPEKWASLGGPYLIGHALGSVTVLILGLAWVVLAPEYRLVGYVFSGVALVLLIIVLWQICRRRKTLLSSSAIENTESD